MLNEYSKRCKTETKVEETAEESEDMFQVCLKAELTPASLDEYRQKLFYLQRLDPVICEKYFNSIKFNKEHNFHDVISISVFLFMGSFN